METRKYYRQLAIIGVVVLVIIIGLGFALYNNGPRVRLVQFSRDINESSLNDNIIVTLSFDRRIQELDLTKHMRITPEVEASYQIGEKDLFIRLQENLQHDTTYTIELDPVVKDSEGIQMSDTFVYQFTTPQPSYAYLERTYSEQADGPDTAVDTVFKSTLNGEPEVLFTHPRIRSFAINNNYLVVAVQEEQEDSLFTINLEDMSQRQEEIQFGGRIENLSVSPFGNVALMTIEPDINAVSQTFYTTYTRRVVSLDMVNGTFDSLLDETGERLRAIDIEFDSDGQLALIQAPNRAFYAISPFNDYEPISLGTYDETYGVVNNGSEILFRENDRFIRYQIDKQRFIPIFWGFDGVARDIEIGDRDSIFVSSIPRSGTDGREELYRLTDFWVFSPMKLWEESRETENDTLSAFSVNYDNSLLGMTRSPKGCQFDNFNSDSQCTDVRTEIYNAVDQEVIRSFDGFNLTWLP